MTPFLSLGFELMVLILLAALCIDLLGEPPEIIHPTVWIGKAIAFLTARLNQSGSDEARRAKGIVLALVTVVGSSFVALILLDGVRIYLGLIVLVILSAIILKTTFALNSLIRFVRPISQSLQGGDLTGARQALQKIVRRPTGELQEGLVVSGAVECVAESIPDGITSPLFFFALFGVPGAVGFRAINTLDSMVAYKTEEFRLFGWMSAKLDTIAGYIPARVSALLIVLSSLILGEDYKNSIRILLRDRGKTKSVNAGWPMAAMAGALHIQLEKSGNYILGDDEEARSFNHIRRSIRIALVTSILFVIIVVVPVLFLLSHFFILPPL